MKEILLLLKDYWFLILFVLGGVMFIWNAIKKKIPSLERRVEKIETQIFDDKGNEMIMTEEECSKERESCQGTICGKLDKLETVIKNTALSTKDSIEKSERTASDNIRDLHEKREVTTKEIKSEIATVVTSVNKQINGLTLVVGNLQGEMKRIRTGSAL